MAQHIENLLRALGIEIPGGLVGKYEPWRVHQSAGDRDALQLASGELARRTGRAPFETDGFEHRVHPAFDFGVSHTKQRQGQRDVLKHIEVRQDMEGLKDETHLRAAQQREGVIVERRELDSAELDRSRVGTV